MKKFLLIISFIFFFCLTVQSQETDRQEYAKSRILREYSFNWGIVTNHSFSFNPFYAQYGLDLDWVLNQHLFFSTELYLVSYRFNFSPLFLSPGLLANFKAKDFAAGLGLLRWFRIAGKAGNHSWQIKLQAGIDRSYRIMAFILTPVSDIFSSYSAGLSIGFRL